MNSRKPYFMMILLLSLSVSGAGLGMNIQGQVTEGTTTLETNSWNNWYKVDIQNYPSKVNFRFSGDCSLFEELRLVAVQNAAGEHKTIEIQGRGERADYKISATGRIEPAFGITGEDTVSENTAEGAVNEGVDVYNFQGSIEHIDSDGNIGKKVYEKGLRINETAYNPCESGIGIHLEEPTQLYVNLFKPKEDVSTLDISLRIDDYSPSKEGNLSKIDSNISDSPLKDNQSSSKANNSANSTETANSKDNSRSSQDTTGESAEIMLGFNLAPLLLLLGLTGYYSYSRGIKRLLTYSGEGLTVRAIIRNCHLLFMTFLLGIFSLIGLSASNWAVFSYIMFFWMIPTTLYWTPPVQIRLYNRFSQNLFLYLAVWFTGGLGVLFLFYKLYKNQRERSKILHHIHEEKEAMINSIEDIEVPPRLKSRRAELVQEARDLGNEVSFQETRNSYRDIEDQVKILKEKSEKYRGKMNSLENKLDNLEKDARGLKSAGHLDSDSEIFEIVEGLKGTQEVEDFQEELDRLESEVNNRKKDAIRGYIQRFVGNHGRGNHNQVMNLKKSIQKREDIEVSKEFLKEFIEEEAERKEKEALKELLELHNPESYEDYLEAFVLEFGKGNEVQKIYLAEILGYWKEKIESDIRRVFKEQREEKELEQFEQDLGLAEGDVSTSESKINNLGEEKRELLENIERRNVSLDDLEDLTGLEFEDFLGDLFDKMGYKAKVTKGSNDQGADLIAEKPHEKLVIQAKHYQDNVGNSAVQEVNTALDYYGGDRGIVVCTSGFTSSAKELAQESEVELWDRDKLRRKIEKYLNESEV